ncbi:Nif3-like dinuclear metal center hexameric protein [Polluticaenibacter yanchengensis]|uniref:GTP cyclohydrolase 1 type 2 homolog n=1 Tax=Polluticaenibacter yanchengensis TaxID=3014562 RepID=A0ABT4ULF9_9BACT|nr:Nif3-like dinuclear metal center hexameric protein [Chitinophagaceae bacterium LY-5]
MNINNSITDIITTLEASFPVSYQESYDNCGLIVGNYNNNCTGILCALDCTEKVVEEAINLKCNLIITHHPLIFSGIKKLSTDNYINRTIVLAIKNNINIYAIHTNLDNFINGVNSYIFRQLRTVNKTLNILKPKSGLLCKLYTYVPNTHLTLVRDELFKSGAGQIGNYSSCSFNTEGTGTFKPLQDANPFIGNAGGDMENVSETKLEVIFPVHKKNAIIKSLNQAHPYESVAYEIITLENENPEIGSGMISQLESPIEETDLLALLKATFNLPVIKHTALSGKPVKKIAVCGGAGSFLIKDAIAAKADVFITSDLKYHEFFDADNKILLIDIGHWESEQFTINLIVDFLNNKFPNFATFIAGEKTNPVNYYI